MDTALDIPGCPVPWESPSEVVPMLVVLTFFLSIGWLYRRIKKWRKKRKQAEQQ